MNIKEQELIEQHLNEASSKDYSKLSTTELKDLLTIFKNVSRNAAKPVIGAINRELNTRVSEETRIEEAKVVPFKKLEQAWTRTGGDKGKQAKLIKKHDLKKIISTVRPGEIKLGVKNKLLGTTKAATAAGLDLDDQLIFVTNNPLKIIYPKKSSRRPEGEEIKESVDVAAARLEKMVSLVLKENDLETIKSFIENSDIDLSTAPSKIRESYKSFDLEEAKNITVRALRQMMFKLDSSAADKFRKELFKVDAQDSPASNAQIKKGMKIAGNKFGKKEFQEAYDSDEKHTMDPKSHVERNKESGMYCVYNVKGKKVKEFESKEDAEDYAVKNHDALMKESADLGEGKDDYIVVIQGAGDNKQKIIQVFKGTQLDKAKKYKDDWNKKNANKIKKNKKGQPMAAHGARLYNHPAGSTVNGKPNIPKVGDSASWSTFGNRVIKEESTDLDEASKSDIKKVLDAGKKAGGKIKGNTIDFGMGAKIDVSLEKGKIKLDGGRDGVELFKNVKDALMAFEETQHVMEGE